MKRTTKLRLHMAWLTLVCVALLTMTVLIELGLVKVGSRYGGHSHYATTWDRIVFGIGGSLMIFFSGRQALRAHSVLKRCKESDSEFPPRSQQ